MTHKKTKRSVHLEVMETQACLCIIHTKKKETGMCDIHTKKSRTFPLRNRDKKVWQSTQNKGNV